MVCVLDNAGMSVSDNPSQGIVREGLWPFVCFGLCLNDFPDVWNALKNVLYCLHCNVFPWAECLSMDSLRLGFQRWCKT